MKKQNKQNDETVVTNEVTTNEQENVQVEVSNTNTEAATEVKEPKKLGRPVVPGSKRQQRIQELEARRSSPDWKLGRPINPQSKKQLKEKQRAEMIAAGITPKRGRPKMIKAEVKQDEVTQS